MNATRASQLAEKAHRGQKYGTRPYTDHLADVARRVSMDAGSTLDHIVVAWLHDVIEDTPYTLQDLRAEGVENEQLYAIEALTRKRGEEYFDFLRRLVLNPIASRVKMHDLESNLEAGPPAHLEAKYRQALPFVRDAVYSPPRVSTPLMRYTDE